MRIFFLITSSFLFIVIAMHSCNHNTKQTNEKQQKGEIVWINEHQGYFIDPRDAKKYKIVKIGSQTWFAENLVYKPDRGDFWAYNNDTSNLAKYGYLYFWETAIHACPNGWHVPSNEEWNTLIDFLGGNKEAGAKLKATNGWKSPNTGVTNSSGFNALPAGNRAVGGSFYHLADDALFWSSTPDGSNRAWKIRLNCQTDTVGFQDCSRNSGRSVRCIKD